MMAVAAITVRTAAATRVKVSFWELETFFLMGEGIQILQTLAVLGGESFLDDRTLCQVEFQFSGWGATRCQERRRSAKPEFVTKGARHMESGEHGGYFISDRRVKSRSELMHRDSLVSYSEAGAQR